MPAQKCRSCMMNATRRLREDREFTGDSFETIGSSTTINDDEEENYETSENFEDEWPERQNPDAPRDKKKIIVQSTVLVALLLLVPLFYELSTCLANYMWRLVYIVIAILGCAFLLIALTGNSRNENNGPVPYGEMEYEDQRFRNPPTIGRFGLYLLRKN